MIKLLGGNEVSEEVVRFLVNSLNQLKDGFDTTNKLQINSAAAKEAVEGLSILWDTVGGANRIGTASEELENIDSKILESLFQTQADAPQVDYSKEQVLANTIYNKGDVK